MVRAADPQGVLGHLVRQRLGHPAQRVDQQRAVGLERPAAEPVAVEADGRQLGGALPAQRLRPAALHDREDPWPLVAAPLRQLAIELIARSLRPPHRALDGALLLGLGRFRISAVVEADRDVAAKLELEADDPLRREVPLLARRWLPEDDLVVADHAPVRILANERPDLEATRVAQDRPLPVHEPMDPAGGLDDAGARTAEEVEGIDHHALDPDPSQVLAAGAAHAGAGRIGQEGRHRQRRATGDERISHPARARTRARRGPMPP